MSYAQEKAASSARKAAIWAEAEAAYDRWFRDLSGRVGFTDVGKYVSKGANDRQLPYGPICRLKDNPDNVTCGGTARALGMCLGHYYQWYHSKRRPGIPGSRSGRTDTLCGHSGHHSRGLCKRCYNYFRKRHPQTKARQQRLIRPGPSYQPQKKLAWRCPHTDRPMAARGLCQNCYRNAWARARRGNDVLPPKARKKRYQPLRATCHKDRPSFRRGMCSPCYQAWYKRKVGRIKKPMADRWRPGMALKCGHTRPNFMGGRCHECYGKWRYQRAIELGRKRGRPHFAHCHIQRRKVHGSGWCQECWDAGRRGPVPAQCHPERPAYARGLCIRCRATEKQYEAWVARGKPALHPRAHNSRTRYIYWSDPRDWSEVPAHPNRRLVA